MNCEAISRGKTNILLHVYKELVTDKLVIPSLPDICIKIKNIAAKPASDATTLGKAAKLDPAFCGYLLKLSNSPMYRGTVKINNVSLAIGRLGMQNTCNIARIYAIRSLFKSRKRSMQKWLQAAWTTSTYTAAVASVIAEHVNPKFDPDEALLAGLIQDIGCLPLIAEASQHPELIEDELSMKLLFDNYAATLGVGIVKEWGLDDRFVEVVRNRDNWKYDDSNDIDLTDLVLVAKIHTYLTQKNSMRIPKLNNVPSFEKLMNKQQTSPEMSLQFVNDAKQKIADTMRTLRG